MTKKPYTYVTILDNTDILMSISNKDPITLLRGIDTNYNTHIYIDGIKYIKNGA